MTTKRKIPMRKCVGCGRNKTEKRIDASFKDRRPENSFVDATWQEANGRGASSVPERKECFEESSEE